MLQLVRPAGTARLPLSFILAVQRSQLTQNAAITMQIKANMPSMMGSGARSAAPASGEKSDFEVAYLSELADPVLTDGRPFALGGADF
jgi:hypothetical protein